MNIGVKTERASSVALIAGSIGSIITMAFHPTGRDLMASGHFEAAALRAEWVHALAIACLAALFFGVLGLSRRLMPSQSTVAALVTYAIAVVAAINAGVISGFLSPQLYSQAMMADANTREVWNALIYYSFRLNQAFAQVFVVGVGTALLLWSIAMLKDGTWGRLALYGCIFGPLTMIALFSGHLRLNVHGFGAVVLIQAIWFVWAGVRLWQRDETAVRA